MISRTPTTMKTVLPAHFDIGLSEIEPPAISAEKNSFFKKAKTIAKQPPMMTQIANSYLLDSPT
jgi:hypothetical protein